MNDSVSVIRHSSVEPAGKEKTGNTSGRSSDKRLRQGATRRQE